MWGMLCCLVCFRLSGLVRSQSSRRISPGHGILHTYLDPKSSRSWRFIVECKNLSNPRPQAPYPIPHPIHGGLIPNAQYPMPNAPWLMPQAPGPRPRPPRCPNRGRLHTRLLFPLIINPGWLADGWQMAGLTGAALVRGAAGR